MLSPLNLATSPPRPHYYTWRDETGFTVVANNPNVFLGKVEARLVQIGGFLGHGWREQAMDQACRNNPGMACRDKDLPERHQTLDDAKQFLLVMERHLEKNFATVSQEEAERRAGICQSCPMNRPLARMCPACPTTAQFFSWGYRLARGKSTSHDAVLSSCSVCSCDLKLAVWMTMEALRDDRFAADEYPGHCWKRPPDQ